MKKNKTLEKKTKALEIDASRGNHRFRNNLILGAIIFYVLVLFGKSLSYEFVNWDDPDYVTGNLLIRDFSLTGLGKILVTPVIGMYNPIPFVLYAIQYKIWGLDPKYFHLFGILLHLLSTITIFRFIWRLTKRYETATIVALLFAIHPMHVSVVTWVSETKTSLFLIFYFLALGNYLKYIENNYKTKYLVYMGLLFILSCLSKPEAVTLAPMLLLLDYYLGRKMDRRLLIEKIPFFAIALFFGVLTLLTHKAEGDTIFQVAHSYSLINNFLVSNYSIAFYIDKLFYPKTFSLIYPYPENAAWLPLKYYVSIPVIPLLILLVYKSGKFRKEMIFGLLFFVISISILIRIVPSGFFGVADRYTYLSYVGLFFIMGQYMVYILDNKFGYSKKVKWYALAILCYYTGFCTWKTTKRISVWENSITLFDDVIKKEPTLLMAYNQRAVAKSGVGDRVGAIADLTKAIEMDPKYVDAYNNRGSLRTDLKDFDGALKDANMAISLNPEYANAYNTRANIEVVTGKLNAALTDYDMAIKLNFNMGQAYYNRASLRIQQGDTLGAIQDWRVAANLGIEQAGPCIQTYCSSN